MCAYCDEKSEHSPCISCIPVLYRISEIHQSDDFPANRREVVEKRESRVQELMDLAARKLPLFTGCTRERYHPSRPDTYRIRTVNYHTHSEYGE